jgi:exopolysaccharide biosynthesis protein
MPEDTALADPEILATPTATPSPAPTPELTTWTFQNERIDVTVERHSRGDYVYFAADIQLTDPTQFAYAFAGERYGSSTESLSDIAQRHDPVLAINGDYYSFHDNGIIIRGGELFRAENTSRAMLIVENDGDLRVMTDRTEAQSRVATQLMEEGVLHTFEFGPVLVNDGKAVSLKSSILRTGNEYLEPRTAIGQLGPLHYLVIVVDGRSEGYSEGCSLSDLRALFVEYGVQVAFNLDGGGSTTLWFDGEVINRPAAGEEREVSDIVMFMP